MSLCGWGSGTQVQWVDGPFSSHSAELEEMSIVPQDHFVGSSQNLSCQVGCSVFSRRQNVP